MQNSQHGRSWKWGAHPTPLPGMARRKTQRPSLNGNVCLCPSESARVWRIAVLGISTPSDSRRNDQLKLKLADLAISDAGSPLHGLKTLDIDAKDGKLTNKNNPSQTDSLTDLIARNDGKPVEAMGSAEPSESRDAMTSNSWGAVFAEVAVDNDTPMVKVRRVLATYDIGTLLNNKTGLNQLMGASPGGILCPI